MASEAAVEPLGRRVGAGIATFLGWHDQPRGGNPGPEGLLSLEPGPHPAVSLERPWPSPPTQSRQRLSRNGAPRQLPASSRVRQPGIRVTAQNVLRLAEMGASPVGIPVAAGAGHPAGLSLQGVSGLGIGLEDGDILVRAHGQPALDPGAVISAIIASRGRRVPVITGEVWRAGRTIPLVVEQPYLVESGDAADGRPAGNYGSNDRSASLAASEAAK